MAINQAAWSETALVTITKYADAGGTNYEYAALTETIDIDLGDKDIDQIVNLKGGRMVKKIGQDITTITLECYPVDIDAAGSTGVSQLFESGTWDTTEPMEATSSRSRDMFRVALLWTDDTAATSGAGATAAATNSYRITFAHAYCTSMKPSFTDGILKFTLQFKCPAFNPQGVAIAREDSGDATALVALNTYSSTNYPPLGTAAYTW